MIRQSFSDKVFSAIVIIFILKLVYIIFSSHYSGTDILTTIAGTVILFLILGGIASGLSGNLRTTSGKPDSNVLLRTEIFNKIQKKYRDLAKQYEEEKQYVKAAHVYLKLLKDKSAAAQTLEKGKLYNEAALIYLKHLNNKVKAAECYENAMVYRQALKYYEELDEKEKVGDMYRLLNEESEARIWYQKVIDDYRAKSQFVKASLVCRNKLKDTTEAQNMLLEGWRTGKDGYNCLNNYFENIKDVEQLNQEIVSIYQNETNEQNKVSFLEILKHEFKKEKSLQEVTKNIAYEIIAERLDTDKLISSELIHFNSDNRSILKDIVKFKVNKKKKGK